MDVLSTMEPLEIFWVIYFVGALVLGALIVASKRPGVTQ